MTDYEPISDYRERCLEYSLGMLDKTFMCFIACAAIICFAIHCVKTRPRPSGGRVMAETTRVSNESLWDADSGLPESGGRSMPGEPSVAARVPAKAAPSKLLVGPEERAKKIVKITWIITAIAILVGLVWAMKLPGQVYGSLRGSVYRVVKKTHNDKVWYTVDEREFLWVWEHLENEWKTEEEARKAIIRWEKKDAPTISEVLVSNNINQGEVK